MILTGIVAIARNGVIGRSNQLPWHLPLDLKFFKQTTMGHHIIMGRRNFESIGRALPGRTSIVLSRDTDLNLPAGVLCAQSLQQALQMAQSAGDTECFVIGGAQIYELALPLAQRWLVTMVQADVPGDVLFPGWDTTATAGHTASAINGPIAGGPWDNQWQSTSLTQHPADEKNTYATEMFLLSKKNL